MKNSISVEAQSSYEINKDMFQDYLINNYVDYGKEYRPALWQVINNYLEAILDEYFSSNYIVVNIISNLSEITQTLDKWANEYLKKINFNEK